MMTAPAFNAFCATLPGATHVVQWEGADVWKVCGKMFAVGAWTWGAHAGITFKVSPMSFDLLCDLPGVRPAPYMASRGLKWVQVYGDPGLGDDDLRAYLTASHAMIVAALPKRKRADLLPARVAHHRD